MITLALDTSTPVASVALSANGSIYERAEQVSTYSERLMKMIDEVFAEAGVAPKDLDAIVCGAGPGSFTGLRMGLSTAKGLCLGLGCKLLMVSSLEALAAQRSGVVLAALDAFRGEIFVALYRDGHELMAPFSAAPDALHLVEPPAFSIGDAFVKYPVAAFGERIDIAPRARELLALGIPRLQAGAHDDPRTAAPRYVRASAPEEAASKKP